MREIEREKERGSEKREVGVKGRERAVREREREREVRCKGRDGGETLVVREREREEGGEGGKGAVFIWTERGGERGT